MSTNTTSQRESIVKTAQQLVTLNLNRGTAGNIGVRNGEQLLVTPSGVPVDEMTSEMIVALDFNGETQSVYKPTSEWHIHRDVLAARPEINAVIHTHSPFSTTLACQQKEIPAFHYMIAAMGGDTIRCAPYALFGTEDLSQSAIAALHDRKACLLAHHGMIVVGADLKEALAVAVELESLCEQYWRVCQLGEPKILSDEQMQEVLEKFKNYGQWAEKSPS